MTTKWQAHTGEDYSVVMRDDETTDSASIRVNSQHLAEQIADLLNGPTYIPDFSIVVKEMTAEDKARMLEAMRSGHGGGLIIPNDTARLDELVAGLVAARDQFLVYEAHHRASAEVIIADLDLKREREAKAKTNADMAARLTELIDRAGGGGGHDVWHVGEIPGDDGCTIRDENGLTVNIATTPAQALEIVEAHNAAIGEG